MSIVLTVLQSPTLRNGGLVFRNYGQTGTIDSPLHPSYIRHKAVMDTISGTRHSRSSLLGSGLGAALLIALLVLLALPPTSSPAAGPPIQLCIAVDGSSSIEAEDFATMKMALAAAIEDSSVVTQDGAVELTVIQFGATFSQARVVAEPTVIDNAGKASSIANAIRADTQLGGYTPTDLAIDTCKEKITGSANFAGALKQAINISTDGNPNSQASAITSRDNAVAAGIDEVDLEAIGQFPSISNMLEIAYPRPGYIAPPFTGAGGFVIQVATYAGYASAIRQKLQEIIPRPTATPTPTATSTPAPGPSPTATATATPGSPTPTATPASLSTATPTPVGGGGGPILPTPTPASTPGGSSTGGTFLVTRSSSGTRDVVEVDRSGNIVRRVVGFNVPRDIRSISNGRWLIADSGDSRVYEINADTGEVLWGVSDIPNATAARRLPNGNTLIVQNSIPPRVLEITPSHFVVWAVSMSFLCSGDSCSGYPQDVDRLPNGNTLIAIADSSQGVIEVNPSGTIVWQYTGVVAYSATRLKSGYILITDSRLQGGGARAVDYNGTLIWNYAFGDLRDAALSLPRDAQLLSNGNVLVADYGKDRVLEIDPTTNTIVWEWVSTNSAPVSAVPALPSMNLRTYLPLASSLYEGAW